MSFVVTEWKDIPGFPGYQASSDGRVRSLTRVVTDSNQWGEYKTRRNGKELKQQVVRLNRRMVCPSVNGVAKYEFVHRLVALAFLPNPEGLPVVMHLDNDPTNNAAENLCWGTYSDNTIAAVKDGLMPVGEQVQGSKLNPKDVRTIRSLREQGSKLRELAKLFSVSEAAVHKVCSKKTWAHV